MTGLSPMLGYKVAFASVLPLVAWAATNGAAAGGAENALARIGVTMWIWIVVFALGGWAIADLDKVAELWNPALGTPYERMKVTLTLWKGVLASLGAGVGTFFLAELAPGPAMSALGLKMADGATPRLPHMIVLLLVAGAGYMGSRWWSRLEAKVPGG